MISDIREKTANLTKAVDEFLASIKDREEDLVVQERQSRKKAKIIAEKESYLNDKEEGLTKERELIESEKKANRDKQLVLELKEKKIGTKLSRLQKFMEE